YGLSGTVWVGAPAPWAGRGGVRSPADVCAVRRPPLFKYFAERLERRRRGVCQRSKTRRDRGSDTLVVLDCYVQIPSFPTPLVLPIERKHYLRPSIQPSGRQVHDIDPQRIASIGILGRTPAVEAPMN